VQQRRSPADDAVESYKRVLDFLGQRVPDAGVRFAAGPRRVAREVGGQLRLVAFGAAGPPLQPLVHPVAVGTTQLVAPGEHRLTPAAGPRTRGWRSTGQAAGQLERISHERDRVMPAGVDGSCLERLSAQTAGRVLPTGAVGRLRVDGPEAAVLAPASRDVRQRRGRAVVAGDRRGRRRQTGSQNAVEAVVSKPHDGRVPSLPPRRFAAIQFGGHLAAG